MTNNCRLCGSMMLKKFLDLGYTPPADGFLRVDQLREPETYYPLNVCNCAACGFVQLDYVVSPEVLYRHDYPYESSITQAGQRHWKEFADTVCCRLNLGEKDLVIDIGSNVGVLLEYFRNNGTRILGVDPASNIVRIAEKRGIETWDEFFGPHVARRVLAEKGRAAVITGTNVFAHVDNLREFVTSVASILTDKGVFIFEAPHFGHLLEKLEYDTIYHEHLSYLSLKPLVPFFESLGLEVFDVQERDIHGGSFRVYVALKGAHPVTPAVAQMLAWEQQNEIYDISKLNDFARKVETNRSELTWLLHSLKRQGKRIAGVSAPAKGMTLLNYCRIGPELLEFVTEKSKLKIGRYTPGVHIPVVGDEELVNQKVDYALLLAWNFAEEIMNNLKEYVAQGGQFIVPVPTPKVVSRN